VLFPACSGVFGGVLIALRSSMIYATQIYFRLIFMWIIKRDFELDFHEDFLNG
jgi:hypothetical protein